MTEQSPEQETPGVLKVKRKRRTKKEMEAARALAASTAQQPLQASSTPAEQSKAKIRSRVAELIRTAKQDVGLQQKRSATPSTVTTVNEEPVPTCADKNPLYAAAAWLAKNMSDAEQVYYRKKAKQHEGSMTNAIISDILGFFNVQSADICKLIKRNQSIINTSNGIRN